MHVTFCTPNAQHLWGWMKCSYWWWWWYFFIAYSWCLFIPRPTTLIYDTNFCLSVLVMLNFYSKTLKVTMFWQTHCCKNVHIDQSCKLDSCKAYTASSVMNKNAITHLEHSLLLQSMNNCQKCHQNMVPQSWGCKASWQCIFSSKWCTSSEKPYTLWISKVKAIHEWWYQ